MDPWRPRRVLLVHSVLRGLADVIAARRSDLELRTRPPAELTPDDLAWAEVYLGFRGPADGRYGGVRWVHCTGAGVDGFLFGGGFPAGVLLTKNTEPFGPQIAEYCLSRALAFEQRLPELLADQRARRWEPVRPRPLRGRRVVIVGAGEIGTFIARAFDAVGCEVHGVARRGGSRAPFRTVRPVSELADAVGGAEVIVLATPLTSETRHLVGREVLRGCRGAILINVGRGAVLDEAVLPEALDARWLRGVALDVFEVEPLPADSPLWERADVLVSPHVSGLSTVEGTAESFLAALEALERGEEPPGVVDPRRGY